VLELGRFQMPRKHTSHHRIVAELHQNRCPVSRDAVRRRRCSVR
jgi:hypothetical protein